MKYIIKKKRRKISTEGERGKQDQDTNIFWGDQSFVGFFHDETGHRDQDAERENKNSGRADGRKPNQYHFISQILLDVP